MGRQQKIQCGKAERELWEKSERNQWKFVYISLYRPGVEAVEQVNMLFCVCVCVWTGKGTHGVLRRVSAFDKRPN